MAMKSIDSAVHLRTGDDELGEAQAVFQIRPSKGISLIMLVVAAPLGIYGVVANPFIFFKVMWGVFAFGLAIFHGVNVFSRRGVSFIEVRRKGRRRLR
ncbi:hypothetical protein [Paenibacillus methanolicus]|nr:hypothetical protein [Paenibacillus methanolicus]